MDKLKAWFASHSDWTHSIAAGIAFLGVAYFQVPVFHDSVNAAYAHFPHWAKEIVTVGLALYGWYRNGQKNAPPPQGGN